MLQSKFNENVSWYPAGATAPDGKILNGGWYFTIASCILSGPYLTEEKAIVVLKVYVNDLNKTTIDFDGRSDDN